MNCVCAGIVENTDRHNNDGTNPTKGVALLMLCLIPLYGIKFFKYGTKVVAQMF